MIIQKRQATYLGVSQFVRRFRELLWRSYPEAKNVPREKLDQFIFGELERAHGYRLRSEHAIGMYVLAAWQLGSGFDERLPTVRERLSRTDWDDELKAYWLQTFTIDFLKRLEQGDRKGAGHGVD